MASIEERVEDLFKKTLDDLNIIRYPKTESINREIKEALKNAESKTGGAGGNYPDIQILINNHKGRSIPVMMEVKGLKDKLEKLEKDGSISTKPAHINNYAVNGAYHYGLAILQEPKCHYDEVIIVGMNASDINKDLEAKAYYISKGNGYIPKHIKEIDTRLKMFSTDNTEKLMRIVDKLVLTEHEQEEIVAKLEVQLESAVKKIHQSIYDDERLKTALTTNEKLYLLCGLIMAGLETDNVGRLKPEWLDGRNNEKHNDGHRVLEQIDWFLTDKNCSQEKVDMVISILGGVFKKPILYKVPEYSDKSIIKELYIQVLEDIIPQLQSPFHLDFTGRILNCLNDWVSIENDVMNDVVLTPRYVTKFMAQLCKTNKDSMVLDTTMGSGGFLVSAMDLMIRDAKEKISDERELKEKIRNIQQKQILGIEILGNIYILAVLNMILMGDGSSNLMQMDSHNFSHDFPATVFLLNPPYSADGKGFIFVEEATRKMTTGYACVLIQENAGSGQGGIWTKKLLEHNTLIASIHMPDKLFTGKASVQTSIYLFKVNQPHDKDSIVKFFDMSNDGYNRQNRKKSTQEINLRDVDDAKGRYTEVIARVLGKNPKTNYYNKDNRTYFEDTISLEGNDWTFGQHRKIDTTPTEADFKKTIANYLSFKVSQLMNADV